MLHSSEAVWLTFAANADAADLDESTAVALLAYRLRCMTSHVRERFDGNPVDPGDFGPIFEKMQQNANMTGKKQRRFFFL